MMQKYLPVQQFHSKHGRAYLFNAATNYVCGDREERLMTTGLHVVCDVYCCKVRSQPNSL